MAINWSIIGQKLDLVRNRSKYGRPTLGYSTQIGIQPKNLSEHCSECPVKLWGPGGGGGQSKRVGRPPAVRLVGRGRSVGHV